MTSTEDDFEFCPKCGKILVEYNNKYRCPKCKINIFSEKKKEKNKQNVISFEKGRKDAVKGFDFEKKDKAGIKDHVEDKTKKGEEWKRYFPYKNIRPQQKQIIQTIREGVSERKDVIVQAANGVGKTIAILSSLLPYSKTKNKPIIYCCRTHEQMNRITSELKSVRQFSKVSGIALRGRKELCINPLIQKFAIDAQNASDICGYLKKEGKCKYFTQLSNKTLLKKILKSVKNTIIDNDELGEIGETFEVCPYELSKKILLQTDVVTTSYQYIFNPFIRNSFLNNLQTNLNDIVLIIDEAHNLPDTAVDISSDTLSIFSIENALAESGKYNVGILYDVLEAFSSTLTDMTANLDYNNEISYQPEKLISRIEKRSRIKLDFSIVEALARLGEKIKEEKMQKNKSPTSYSTSVARFIDHLLETKTKQEYAHFVSVSSSRSGNRVPRLTTLSLDPRTITKNVLKNVDISISASGTLEPIEAYTSLVGLETSEVKILTLESPYDDKNIQTLVVQKVSTKLKYRTPENYKMMIDIINKVVKATPRNVGVFCASYSVLESLLEYGLENKLSKPLYAAHRKMSSSENDVLVSNFKEESQYNGGVLLSVLGGRSSEGSDYPAELMHSVIIVGIPFARPDPKIEASIKYLETQFPNRGREFGYNIPALRRASQAAGRPIRGLNDYATIVLLDYRFGIRYYRRHLPKWIRKNMRIVQPKPREIEKRTEEFFEYHF